MKAKRCLLSATILLALATSMPAHAAWMVNGIWYSNICRLNINPNWYWVYPVVQARPVGSVCYMPDGAPGYVSAY